VADQDELTMAGQAVLTITPPAGSPSTSLAPIALNLGWRMAELYAAPVPRGPIHLPPAVRTLPGSGALSSNQHFAILVGQVDAAIKPLRVILQTTGLEPESGLAYLRGVASGADPTQVHKEADVRAVILSLHITITERLASSAPGPATAYGLGRALADTCHVTADSSAWEMTAAFDHHRLENLYDWLGQLEEIFPDRAARAVTQSLRMWQSWIQAPPRRGRYGRLTASPDATAVTTALIRQGALWRRVLTAEQDPLRLLGPQDYVNAGVGFLIRVRRIVTQFVMQWAWVIAILLAGLGASVWAAVTYASTDVGKLTAVLVSLVGAFGLSWKGVGGTLGKALSVVQKPLWDAEVDTALAQAVTRLPAGQHYAGATRADGTKHPRGPG